MTIGWDWLWAQVEVAFDDISFGAWFYLGEESAWLDIGLFFFRVYVSFG